MRHVIWLLAAFCLAGCRTTPPPTPAPGGVNIDVPFVSIRTGNSPPAPPIVVEEMPKKPGL